MSDGEVEVVLEEFSQVVQYRGGHLLTLLKKKRYNKEVILDDLYVSESHICVSLCVPKHSICCVVMLDLVPSHVPSPTPLQVKQLLEHIMSGSRVCMSDIMVLYPPSPIVSFEFLPRKREEETNNVCSILSFVLVAKCGYSTTGTFDNTAFSWDTKCNILNLIDAHQLSQCQFRRIESAHVHIPTMSLMWTEIGWDEDPDKSTSITVSRCIMSARFPMSMFEGNIDRERDEESKHSSEESSQSPTGEVEKLLSLLHEDVCFVSCPLLHLSPFQSAKSISCLNDFQIKIELARNGCWILIPHLSSQHASVVRYSVLFINFSNGLRSDIIELPISNTINNIKSEKCAKYTAVSMVLLDVDGGGKKENKCDICSSVLIFNGDLVNNFEMIRVSYFNGRILLRNPIQLPCPSNCIFANCSNNISRRIVSMTIIKGTLLILLSDCILFSTLSCLMAYFDELGRNRKDSMTLWQLCERSSYPSCCLGFWKIPSYLMRIGGEQERKYYGSCPSIVGSYTARAVMYNVHVRFQHKPRMQATYTVLTPSLILTPPSTLTTAKWFDSQHILIPPLQYLQALSGSNTLTTDTPSMKASSPKPEKSNFNTTLVSIISHMNEILICYCCQSCCCSHSYATPHRISSPCATSTIDLLCRLLSQNASSTDSIPRISCKIKMMQYFSDMDANDSRPFDLNDFVKSVEGCSDNIAQLNCSYVEETLRHLLRNRFETDDLVDFILVVLYIAFSLYVEREECSCSGRSLCSCRERKPSTAYIILRRCLLTTLRHILRSNEEDVEGSCSKLSPIHHWSSFQICSDLIHALCQNLKQEADKKNFVPASHQNVLLLLISLCGDVVGVIEILEAFQRHQDVYEVGRDLFYNFNKYIAICNPNSESFIPVTRRSALQPHICCKAVDDCDGTEDIDSENEDCFGETWVTKGDSDSDDDGDLIFSDASPSSEVSAAVNASEFMSDATAAYVQMNYRVILNRVLFSALYTKSLVEIKCIIDNIVWSLCIDATDHNEFLIAKKRQFIAEIVQRLIQEMKECSMFDGKCKVLQDSSSNIVVDKFIDSLLQ